MTRLRAAALAAVLLVVLAAGLAWRWPRPAPAVRVLASTPPSAPMAAPAPIPPASFAASVVAAAPRRVAPTASRALSPGEIDVCGLGIVQGEPVHDPGQPPRFDLPKAVEERLERQLRQQLIPDLLRTRQSGVEAAAALLQKRTGDLVRLALRDRDPRTVQWAVQACLGGGEPDCALLPPRLWVEIEPDNGYAWLVLMSADPSAQVEALYRLTQASRFDERWGAVAGTVDAALPPPMPLAQRMTLLAHAMGADAALPLPSYAVLVRACDDRQIADANRRQQCQMIAELLTGHGQSLLSRKIGQRLGERLGWPAERLDPLRRRISEAIARQTKRFDEAAAQAPHSCGQMEALSRIIRDVGRLGEWGALTQPAPPR